MKVSINIGINRFDENVFPNANLSGCVGDSLNMSSIAKKAGFTPTLINDEKATIKEFVKQMKQYAKSMTEGDSLMLSFSGHGTYDDSSGTRITGLCFHDGIFWDFQIKKLLMKFKAGVSIIWITDSCFSEDNFKFASPSLTNGKAKFILFEKIRQLSPPTTEIITLKEISANIVAYTSSNQYQPSYDTEEGGVFTKAFIKAFNSDNYSNFYKLYLKTQKNVAQSGYPQTPMFQVVNGQLIKITYRTLFNI